MKRALIQCSLAFAAALSFAVLASSLALAQSTAFTYQGLLDDAGAPTNGLHDFRFRLFDAASGGVAVGSTLCIDNVNVDGDGTLLRGTGFIVNRNSEGAYDITFTPAFSGIPTVMAEAVIGTGQPRWATSAEFFLSASTARIVMITDGSPTDSDFSICVIGPR